VWFQIMKLAGRSEMVSTSGDVVPEVRRYVDHRPYPEPPARLDDLTGPTSGTLELPVTIDWGPGVFLRPR
jgi:hypothetical protein